MRNDIKKKIIILILLFIALGIFSFSFKAQAEYSLEIDYPEIGEAEGVRPEGGLTEYVRYLYLFGLGLVGLAGFAALVFGGFWYMLSDTLTSKEKAKDILRGAISGLILALAAYLILYTINPDLVSTTPPDLEETIE